MILRFQLHTSKRKRRRAVVARRRASSALDLFDQLMRDRDRRWLTAVFVERELRCRAGGLMPCYLVACLPTLYRSRRRLAAAVVELDGLLLLLPYPTRDEVRRRSEHLEEVAAHGWAEGERLARGGLVRAR